jgi:heme O synthase-like polyprenyltransferase
MTLPRALLFLQSGYFLLTGIWPLLHFESFELVTGPKTDDWLVIAVAALVVAVGATLLVAAVRRVHPIEVVVVAVGSALALGAVDLVFVPRGVIPPIYLVDAALEGAFVLGWAIALYREERAG